MNKKTTGVAWLTCPALCLVLLGCGATPPNHQDSAAASLPSGLRLPALDGQTTDPFASPGAKALVFVFIRTDCPISNRYAPELQRLYRTYSPRHVAFVLVYPEDSSEEILAHQSDYRLPMRTLRDPRHVLVNRAAVRVTPEAAVFVPGKGEVYHGRIDDRFADFGKERPAPSKRDLEGVLTQILAGKAVTNISMPAIGCYISDPS